MEVIEEPGFRPSLAVVDSSEESVETSDGERRPLAHIEEGQAPDNRTVYAVKGDAWMEIRSSRPELARRILLRCAVFARMAPDQKKVLVKDLQELGYTVGMCGDGANDCAALKSAHIGVSLSEAEASVAAPFTASGSGGGVSCVPTLVREGRCALVTSFSIFKYMALYSMIQFSAVLMLYTFETNFGDFQFLYMDLVVVTTVSFLMVRTAAYPRLSKKRPAEELLSAPILLSISAQILVVLAVQVCAYFYLTTRPWFTPNSLKEGQELNVECFETTVIFLVSSFQYLLVAMVFSRGPPFRKRFYTNVW